jgi:hypothetical protein
MPPCSTPPLQYPQYPQHPGTSQKTGHGTTTRVAAERHTLSTRVNEIRRFCWLLNQFSDFCYIRTLPIFSLSAFISLSHFSLEFRPLCAPRCCCCPYWCRRCHCALGPSIRPIWSRPRPWLLLLRRTARSSELQEHARVWFESICASLMKTGSACPWRPQTQNTPILVLAASCP